MKIEKIGRLLGLGRKARSVTVGSRETRDRLRRGEVRLVLLAEDGSPRDRKRLTRAAAESAVPARRLATREELGAWLGLGPVSVLGLTDPHLAGAVRAQLDGDGAEAEGGENEHGEN
jgi:ribosomal protein L7Ae-like RNA K-turn-binding protein